MDMNINIDTIEGHSAINKLIERLKLIPRMDGEYMENMYFFIRKNYKAIHINSYDINAINNIHELLISNNVQCIMETEYDIIVPWSIENDKIVRYSVAYLNFKELDVSERDIPHVKLSSVLLLTDDQFLKRYPHNRLTQYALGSNHYINALRTEENLFRTHKCIICTGSFQDIERLKQMLIEQNIPCGNINMDVLCISPNEHIDHLYRLILASMYYFTMMQLTK